MTAEAIPTADSADGGGAAPAALVMVGVEVGGATPPIGNRDWLRTQQ